MSSLVLLVSLSLVFFGLALGVIVFIHNNYHTTVTHTGSETRHIMRQCVKIHEGVPSVKTIYNHPEGRPRQPIAWHVTCNKL